MKSSVTLFPSMQAASDQLRELVRAMSKARARSFNVQPKPDPKCRIMFRMNDRMMLAAIPSGVNPGVQLGCKYKPGKEYLFSDSATGEYRRAYPSWEPEEFRLQRALLLPAPPVKRLWMPGRVAKSLRSLYRSL